MSEDDPKQDVVPGDDVDRVDRAVRKATREAVLTHARSGHSVPTLRDGEVVWLSPEEIFALLANTPPQ